MTTLDRYVIRNFFMAVLLWFIVLMSVRVMADLLFNLDEFAGTSEGFLDRLAWIGTYYSYQSVLYFAELGGIIIVVAAVFSLARMNYSNELTAILASGISLYRVLFPIVIGAIVVGGAVFADREFIIPRISHMLVRDRASDTIKEFSIPLRSDENRTVWYSKKFHPSTETMDAPRVILRSADLQPAVAIMAANGRLPTQAERERLDTGRGWVLEGANIVHAGQEALTSWLNSPSTGGKKAWGANTRDARKTKGLRQVKAVGDAEPQEGRIFTTGVSHKALLTQINDQKKQNIPDEDLVLPVNTDADNGITLHPNTGFALLKPQPDGTYGDLELIEARFDLWVAETTADPANPVRQRLVGSILADRAVWRDHEKTTDPAPHWSLDGGVLFVPTDMDTRKLILRQSSDWVDFLALKDVTKLLTADQAAGAREAELTMHVRMTEPIYNVLLLLLGVPFILSRERNLKTSATFCMLLCMTCFIFIYACKSIDMPPALRAWLPLMVFGPIGAVTVDSIKT